jgi:hypothetical protein
VQLDAIIRTESTFNVWLLDVALALAEPLVALALGLATVPFTSTCSFTCDESSDSCPSSMYSAAEPVVPVALDEPAAEAGADSFRM